MAIVTTPLFNRISGSAAGVDFRTRRNGKIEIGEKRIPTNPQSNRQLEVRAGYGRLHELWQNASYIDKAQYERLGKLYNVSAWNAFLMRHQSAMSRAPVASWGMVESSGLELHDLTTNENNGTISGATWDKIEIPNISFLNFDGIDDFVACGSHASLNCSCYGLGAWFQTNDVAPDDDFGYRLITILRVVNSTRISLILRGSSIGLLYFSLIALDNSMKIIKNYYDGKPHQIFGTYNGTTYKLYFDGIEQLAHNDSLSLNFHSCNLATYTPAQGLLKGNGLSFEIYDYAPSDTQILQNYNNTKHLYGVYP